MSQMSTQTATRFIGILLTIFLFPGAASALVEPGWPAGSANVCRNAADGHMNFESGIEGAQIESTIPGLAFTTTAGINWRYADIRTGTYNVRPYGSTLYEANGNFFAWLGVTGDRGRITFQGGPATYMSVLVSTSSGVQLDAFDAAGTLLATSGRAGSNTGTGTLTRLTVEAAGIAYVEIHDTGNYWLMDDLCTDAPPPCEPVPGYAEGPHDQRIDLLFVPDRDYGGNNAAFLADIANQITQRLGAVAPVDTNLDRFNFYFAHLEGDVSSSSTRCGAGAIPANLLSMCPYADAVVVLHQTTYGDCTSWSGGTGIFGAEGAVGRSFIHEGGHALFGLRDEYDSDRDSGSCSYTAYNTSRPIPSNIWATEADCRADATSQGWDPNQCFLFTPCQGDWWKLGDATLATNDDKYADAHFRFIMFDGTYFSNGFGDASERVINSVFAGLPTAPEPPLPEPSAEKSTVLDLAMSDAGLVLRHQSFVVAPAPNFLPGDYQLAASMVSLHGNVLGEYGFNDPRVVFAESDYGAGPARPSADFTLALPYFERAGTVNVIDRHAGTTLLTVDVSAFATSPGTANVAPVAICRNVTAPADATCHVTGSVNGGSYDAEGDALTLIQAPAAPYGLGATGVTLTVTDAWGDSASCQAVVTGVDVTAPTLVAPANMVVDATSPAGAVVEFAFGASDNCSTPAVTSAPPSGSTFPINAPGEVTIVVGSAQDGADNKATATFTVHVKGAAEQLADLAAAGLPPGGSIANKAAEASLKLADGDVPGACNLLSATAHEVSAMSGKKLTQAQASELLADIARIRTVIGCR